MSERRQQYNDYLHSKEWKAKRKEAIEAAGHRCRLCNEENSLHVHHRTYERFMDENIEDLTVLCASCHRAFHQHRRACLVALQGETKKDRATADSKRKKARAKRMEKAALAKAKKNAKGRRAQRHADRKKKQEAREREIPVAKKRTTGVSARTVTRS